MREILNNQNYRPILLIFGAYLALVLGSLLFIRNVSQVLRVVNALAPLCVLIALIIALRARFGSSQTESSPRIWERIVIGLIFWSVAEGIWSFYFLSGWEKGPGTNAADVFWLVGFVPFIEALVKRYQSYLASPGRSRVLDSILFILALLIPATYILLIPTLIGLPVWAQKLELLTKTTYTLANIAILPFALLSLVTLSRGRLFKVWGLISISFILRSITFFIFTYLIPNNLLPGQLSAIPTIVSSLIHLVMAVGIHGSWLLGQQVALVTQLKLGFVGGETEIPQFLVNTDADGKIVNVSKNFLQFTNNSLLERFIGKPVEEILGISTHDFAALTNICSRGGFVTDQPAKVSAGQRSPVQLLLTAIGSRISNDYFGMEVILQLPNYSAQAFPLDTESNAIIQNILRRTGQQTQENSSYLAEYFTAHIRSFYDLVNQAGSNLSVAAMAGEINETAAKNKWPIRIAGQEVTIEPGFSNFDNAELLKALPVLYKIAEQFTIKATSAKAVADQAQKADRLLSKNALLAAENFGLRQR